MIYPTIAKYSKTTATPILIELPIVGVSEVVVFSLIRTIISNITTYEA